MKTANKTNSLVRVAAVALVVSCISAFQISADASCRISDLENGYYLACLGDHGTCKFIPPEGDPTYCDGNIAFAEPILCPLDDIVP